MLRRIIAERHHDCEDLIGKFLDDSHYDMIVDDDADVYAPGVALKGEHDEDDVLLKFRKNVFSEQEQKQAYEGLIGAAKPSQNRGTAAGPRAEKLGTREWVTSWQQEALDIMISAHQRLDGNDALAEHIKNKDKWEEDKDSFRGNVWGTTKVEADGHTYDGFFDRWVATMVPKSTEERKQAASEVVRKYIVKTNYANEVRSGIAGYFDRYPRIPYGRATTYTRDNPEKFKLAFPYIHNLDQHFKDMLPTRYERQRNIADKLDPRFLIDGTVFTTLTVNNTFRTAAHRDAGDYGPGFSNLGVISGGKDFKGGYLVLPEYRIAVNIRPGDLLLIDNHRAIHGNTPILPVDGREEDIQRMSIVAYFRDKMQLLGSWEYEQKRYEFIEHRRANKEHPDWRPLWNGISADWDESKEWADFLSQTEEGKEMLNTYHPNLRPHNTLEGFFSD